MRIFGLVCAIIVFISCRKDPPAVQPKVIGQHTAFGSPPVLTVEFKGTVNNLNLQPSTKFYTNSSGDFFSVDKFNFYISNVRLFADDGSVFTEKESYHLIKLVEGKLSFTIDPIPEGTYNKIEFLIGVDSARNVSGSQTGDLDVAHQMFWDWDQGYIFYKLEGQFVSDGEPNQSEYAIHVGGFNYLNNCLQTCSFDLPTAIVAKKNSRPAILFNTKIEELFDTPKKIGMDLYYQKVQEGPAILRELSDNYRDMFVVEKIENK